ncbi:MAG: bifunctional 3-(3-hydroxy-phenyl)propionate/3-hydroxycinnamic acid hydroxylase [Acidimicrobiia bacterium]
MDADQSLSTDVLVVGAGPCGVTIANLLGLYGTRAIVIDRETDVVEYPRAVGIDDESLRSCQTIGLVDDVLVHTLQNTPIRYYTSWGRCFAHVKPSAQPFGWPRRNLFLQPLLERTLREGVKRFATIDLRVGHELVSVDDTGGGVVARVSEPSGQIVDIQARYLVGADGGRSTVRDLIGVSLDGTTEPVKWLVIDVENDQLDAPYSAVCCDPVSPVLMVPLPYRHRRFEFRLREGEDEDEVVQPDHVRALLESRYGSTAMPDVVRARVYLHHSRVASTFQVGRVLLAGDAAHLQPPFFGQGMNSGLRDATNLAWKLAAAARGVAGPDLVRTYDAERRPHAAEMVDFATKMGSMYRPRNTVTERLRDLVFRGVQLVPGGRDYILQMKYKPMPRYTEGVVAGVDRSSKSDPVGRMFPQPDVEAPGGRMRLDDAIGPWFAVLGLETDPSLLDPESVAWWRSIGARLVHVARPRAHALGAPGPVGDDGDVLTIEDVDGAFRDWRLARPGDEVIILRPDRYVAATCRRDGFAAVTGALRTTFGTPEEH